MRKISLIVLIVLNIRLMGQLNLSIDTAKVYNIEQDSLDHFIHSGSDEGPLLDFYCHITNNSSSKVVLQLRKSKVKIKFLVNGNEYIEELNLLSFPETDSYTLKQGETLNFFCYSRVYLGTDLLKDKDASYKNELIMTLSSLKMYYEDGINSIENCGIQHVKLMPNESD